MTTPYMYFYWWLVAVAVTITLIVLKCRSNFSKDRKLLILCSFGISYSIRDHFIYCLQIRQDIANPKIIIIE